MEIKAEHTIKKILKYLLIAVVLALILLWFIGGGVGKIIEKARSFQFSSISDLGNATGISFTDFQLPWQIEMPRISVTPVEGDNATGYTGGTYAVDGRPNVDEPSPYVGQVEIQKAAAMTQSPSGQYLELHSAGNKTPLSISGWSLESAMSGVRAYIPEAASLFRMGSVNTVGQVKLAPGGRVIVVTGPSPVGVSFRENTCTGYLGTLQPFVPALPANCPAPLAAIPRTAANEARLGTSCFDYLSTLPSCTFPQNPPSSLSAACRAEIQSTLSYNGCVNQHKNAAGFSSDAWRVYLAWGKPLWNVQNDIIRLLDENGRIVTVLNY